MTETTDRDWQAWTDEWRSAEASAGPSAEVRSFVLKRSRLVRVWMAGEALVVAVFLPFLVHRAVTHDDALERTAMALLALITAGAAAFSAWNWRGAVRASGESTATYLTLSTERSRRLLRAVSAGWLVLAAEILVFVPWVWHRLYATGPAPSRTAEILAWTFLAVMTAGCARYLVWLRQWALRDVAVLERLTRETLDR